MAHDTKEFLQSLLDGGTQYISRIYRVVRSDGLTLRLTDHDNILEIHEGWLDGGDVFANPMDYSPMEGWDGSAARAESAMKVANMEFTGAVSVSAITDEDLHAGLWNGALLDVAWVDWRFPWAGLFRHHHYRLTDFNYDEESWTAQASNLMVELARRQGKRYGKTCWHNFMDSRCGIQFATTGAGGNTHFKGTVNSIITPGSVFLHDDVVGYYAGARNEHDDYFKNGHVKWTDGNNKGQVYPVAGFLTATEQVTLQYPTRAAIQVGDAYELVAGCDGRFSTCKSTILAGNVDNHLNFGGFDRIPGTTQIARAGNLTV